jgi:uncharacterized protein (UPF0264 family)
MTRMLASVSNVEEAIVALEAGADFIDLKNPHAGALGALPMETVRHIVATMNGRRALSATIGDLPMDPALMVERVEQMAETGVDIVKIGIFGAQHHEACIDALRPLNAKGCRIVAVLFADQQPDFALVPRMAEAGFYGVMLDTAQKNGQRLLHHLPISTLAHFVDQARTLGLLSGLAGSLAAEDIQPLLMIQPDYLGFRGALCCESRRTAVMEKSKLEYILQLLRKCNSRLPERLVECVATL